MPRQSDSETLVRGVNSFASHPLHGGVFPEDVAQKARYRMPSVEALETSLNSGVWAAIIGRGAVVPAPGALREGTGKFAGPTGVEVEGSPVMKNIAALCAVLKWHLGVCSEGLSALCHSAECAMLSRSCMRWSTGLPATRLA